MSDIDGRAKDPTPEPAADPAATPPVHDEVVAAEQDDLRRRLRATVAEPYIPGGTQVRWVRASDLLTETTGRAAGHAIDASRALHRAPRELARQTPLEAFGRSAPVQSPDRTLER